MAVGADGPAARGSRGEPRLGRPALWAGRPGGHAGAEPGAGRRAFDNGGPGDQGSLPGDELESGPALVPDGIEALAARW